MHIRNTLNIRCLVDKSFVPVNQQTSVSNCRLSDFKRIKISTVSTLHTILNLGMIIFGGNSEPYDINTLEPRNQKHKLRTRKLIPFGKLIKSLECSIQRSSMRIKFGGNAAGSAHNGRNFQILCKNYFHSNFVKCDSIFH